MANVKGGTIIGTGDYVNIESLFNLTLIEGTKYQVQIQGGAVFCEKATKPSDNEGFYWNLIKPFGYEKASAYLWMKVNKGESVFVNIAE